ncbi:helix-turn-helix domain-containing protein [Hwanghaeella grinnelliae]|uniref:helix-turn-helix domain-containing protein n=1 Tax=Hwanghaeella grinnelliae TaxID=2500179 RepID=UPI001386FA73
MARRDRYSLAPIRGNYTYSVGEVAELYGIADATVFRWIRDEGLKRLPGSKKYYIHSGDLRRFLERLNKRNKKPSSDGEIYCCKCRVPRRPSNNTIQAEDLPNGTIRVKAKCGVCGTGQFKVVSSKNWSETHPLYPDRNDPTIEHSGGDGWPRNCQT